ncbi:hypothetical protein [Microbispora sp. NPDC049633]|uniref:hypothetical protein n=1 Tax=Microbispora sp. NPDC049633 TaxID=3154355 RepID=UPI0034237286
MLPDKTFTVVFNDVLINNRKGEGPHFLAKIGERVEFIVITHGSRAARSVACGHEQRHGRAWAIGSRRHT